MFFIWYCQNNNLYIIILKPQEKIVCGMKCRIFTEALLLACFTNCCHSVVPSINERHVLKFKHFNKKLEKTCDQHLS